MRYISQSVIVNQIFDGTEGNCIFSPTCNVTFFQFLCELVDEKTKLILETIFNYDLQHFESLIKATNRVDKKSAFKIFQLKNYPLGKDTEKLVREKYHSEIESLNDDSLLDIEKSIADWLKIYTNDVFSQLIKGPSITRATSYTINWAKAFDKSKTTLEKFHQNESNSFDVEMMNIFGKFKYVEDEGLQAKIIELPCVNKAGIRHKDLSVLIYLPNKADLHAVDYLIYEERLLELIKQMDYAEVDVSIPKLKIKTENNVKDNIQNTMFNGGPSYNLSNFTNSNSNVSQIVTQGFMEITEDNIMAVGTTGCGISYQPVLKEMHVECDVTNRFAKTLVSHKFFNANLQAQETTFNVILPENAFITEFEMVIEGKSYKSYIKEKEEAKQIYDEAVATGRSAAHVAVSARDSNKFTVSVNVAPKSDAQFKLTYEELLERKLNHYELVLNIHPGQLLEKINVKVKIEESSKIRFVKVPPVRTGNEISEHNEEKPPQTTLEIDNTKAVIQFSPNMENQRKIAKALGSPENSGISGQFVIQYDIDMNTEGGEVLLRDGYFVHFYIPDDLPILPKHVVFALDTSGSMSGRKIQQLRDAMTFILDQIRQEDLISLLDFKHKVIVYDVEKQNSVSVKFDYQENYLEIMHKFEQKNLPTPKEATPQIVDKAKTVAQNLRAEGSTHMIGALEVSLFLVKRAQENWRSHQPIIVFLTDGEPTDGVNNPSEITDIVTKLNMDIRVPIFTLSFGEEADKEFLRKLSLKNFAFSRHIYEAADASLQLQQFYKQISSPLMSNVTFKYEEDIKDITRVNFPIYFRGCHIVMCGRYAEPNRLEAVNCYRNGLNVNLHPRVKESVGPLERFWAFLTIKQLLEQSKYSEDKENLRKRALELALKYSFVTEVTSLVVVKPEENAAVDTKNAAIPEEVEACRTQPMWGSQKQMCSAGNWSRSSRNQWQSASNTASLQTNLFGRANVARNLTLKSACSNSGSTPLVFGSAQLPTFRQAQAAPTGFGQPAARGFGQLAATGFGQASPTVFLQTSQARVGQTQSVFGQGQPGLGQAQTGFGSSLGQAQTGFGSSLGQTQTGFGQIQPGGLVQAQSGLEQAAQSVFGRAQSGLGSAQYGLIPQQSGVCSNSVIESDMCYSNTGESVDMDDVPMDLTENYQIRTPIKKDKKSSKGDSAAKQFKADRPFIIILQSKMQEEIVALFVGKITKPMY